MKTTDTPTSACPYCSYLLEAATHFAEHKPSPGSLAICFNCAGILRFKEDLRQEAFPESQLAILRDTNPESWQELMNLKAAVEVGIKLFGKRGRDAKSQNDSTGSTSDLR